MSRTYKDSPKGRRQPKRVSVRAVRREQPDLGRLRRAILTEAMAEAAAEAAAMEEANDSASSTESLDD